MSCWKTVIIIFAILYCDCQIHSKPRTISKQLIFRSERLVNGPKHIDKTRLAYALCEVDPFEQTARCIVKLEIHAFQSTPLVHSCPVEIWTELVNGRIEFLGVELWGEERVIFTWCDLNNNGSLRSSVTIHNLHMPTCQQVLKKLLVDIREDYQPQIFFIITVNNYIVTFMDREQCDVYFCRMTVDQNGESTGALSWFEEPGLITNIEEMDNHNNNLLVAIGETADDYYMVKYCLLGEENLVEIRRYHYIHHIGYSVSNGILTICTVEVCELFHFDGGLIDIIALNMDHEIREFKALYNLPNGGHLAVICDSQADANYRFVKINAQGQVQRSHNLKVIKCSFKPDYLAIKIYVESSTDEYCVSIFQSIYSYSSWGFFKVYCFPLADLL